MTDTKPKTLANIVPTGRCETCDEPVFVTDVKLLRELNIRGMGHDRFDGRLCSGPVRDMLAGRVVEGRAIQQSGVLHHFCSDASCVDCFPSPILRMEPNGGLPTIPAALVLLGEEGESE